MAFNDIEAQRIKTVVDAYVQRRRPPPHVRSQLDIAFRIDGHSVEIFAIRPAWKRPGELREHPVAKATFVKTKGIWRVFWQRADLKWHSYAPAPTVGSVAEFLELVEADPHGCFWG